MTPFTATRIFGKTSVVGDPLVAEDTRPGMILNQRNPQQKTDFSLLNTCSILATSLFEAFNLLF
jgi:hypothetical protein